MKFKFCPKCAGKLNKKVDCLECAGCGFRIFDNPVASVCVIIRNEKKEILITRRRYNPKKGFWDLPGGFLNIGESGEEAGAREIKEELGLLIKKENLRYLFSIPDTYYYQDLKSVLNLFYEIILPSKSLKGLKCDDDVFDVKFVNPGKVDFKKIAFLGTIHGIKKIK